MSLGLLGALGGLGKGLTQYGQTLFSEAIEEKREARLQAIRDKEYARSRADAVADRQVNQQFQRDLAQENRAFQTSEREASQGFRKTLLNDERTYNDNAITKIMKGDDGELIGFNRSGERTNLGTITVDDDTLSEYMRTFNSLNASLLGQNPNDPARAGDFQLRRSLMSAIAGKLGGSQESTILEAMQDNPGKSREEVVARLLELGAIR